MRQREFTHVNRTTVSGPPEATLHRLTDLPRTIGDDRDLRVEGWPEGGPGDFATFRVSQAGSGDIAYEMHPLEGTTGLSLRATGPQWTASHQVDVQGLPDGSSEVTWQMTLSSYEPVTEDFVSQASALSSATLTALAD